MLLSGVSVLPGSDTNGANIDLGMHVQASGTGGDLA